METNLQRERFTVPIGPQHPALKEPEHFRFTVDGESSQTRWCAWDMPTGALRKPQKRATGYKIFTFWNASAVSAHTSMPPPIAWG